FLQHFAAGLVPNFPWPIGAQARPQIIKQLLDRPVWRTGAKSQDRRRMKVDRVRIYRMRRDATRLVGGSDCLTDQKLSRALGKTIVDRGSPFFMLRFQLDDGLADGSSHAVMVFTELTVVEGHKRSENQIHRTRVREVRIQFPPAGSQVRTCLSREFAFLRRQGAVFRGRASRGERRGRQRRAGIERLSSSAIWRSTSGITALSDRLVRLPPRPGTGDGSPECWRADASWVGGVMRSPARRCGRRGRVPLWPKRG